MEYEVNNKIQKQIIDICHSILSEEMNIFEGSRLIVSLSFSLSGNEELQENEIFYIFRGVDSESDHFPLGDVRKKYNPTYLEQLDNEMRECANFYKEMVFTGCKDLIKFLNEIIKNSA